MIEINEGQGGWTIRVTNGDDIKNFECSQYTTRQNGVNWFDLDRAMRDAEEYNKAHQLVKES